MATKRETPEIEVITELDLIPRGKEGVDEYVLRLRRKIGKSLKRKELNSPLLSESDFDDWRILAYQAKKMSFANCKRRYRNLGKDSQSHLKDYMKQKLDLID